MSGASILVLSLHIVPPIPRVLVQMVVNPSRTASGGPESGSFGGVPDPPDRGHLAIVVVRVIWAFPMVTCQDTPPLETGHVGEPVLDTPWNTTYHQYGVSGVVPWIPPGDAVGTL